MTPKVEVSGGRVAFGSTIALDGVDLRVDAGEVVAVLGPSGSGKSTLLRAIAGLQPLDAGTVLIDGADATATPPHERGVGMMFQHHALFPHLDVGRNVAFGLRMQRRARDPVAARVRELLALVGLEGMDGRDVASLSGGEQQRVALARALAPAPRVLLLDEPLGSLDRPRRERLVVELRALFARLGLTVVAVTHDHQEAFALADRLVLLDRGRILQAGTPDEVWRRPTTSLAAELLGFTNLIDVTVAEGRALSAWGDLGAADGVVRRALVRPEAVRLGGGPLHGTVVAGTFAGARGRVRVELPGAPPLEADLPAAELPAIGAVVSVTLDPAGIALLPA
ncbi:MAG: ABC transporter ATP-binding protein [Acidimicrobiales bacterium]